MEIFQAVPVLQVADVKRTMGWYEEQLGFCGDPFPNGLPYRFAILRNGPPGPEATEIMLRFASEIVDKKPVKYAWDVYLRVRGRGFLELQDRFRKLGCLLREAEEMPYGLEEFDVVDPDGHVVCVSHRQAMWG